MPSTPSPTVSATTPITTPNTSNTSSNSSTTDGASIIKPAGAQNATPQASTSQTRRPPRKSTLTQQQKNQKRQRATQDQLVLLEVEFNKNPTPTAAVRDQIADKINMTERSVQIWFQNRRAKIKLMAKKSIETGEDCDIPQSYREYLAQQAMESGKPLSRNMFNAPMGFGGGGMFMGESQNSSKVVIHHFNCRSLSIGSWRRVGQNAMDLVIFYSLGDKPCLTYYINNESAGYKIEFPFSYIKNITLAKAEDNTSRGPGLLVELLRAPNFFMDSSGSGGFYQVGDFTENQQASQVMLHHLGGDPGVLASQLAKLTVLDFWVNRHLQMFPDGHAIAPSAPVSPVAIARPASAGMMPPPPNVYNDHGFGMGLQPGPRGHKRTRSRSVPAITDFSFLNHPMPSFHVQHPSTTITDPSIFAPIPQHINNLSPANNLRIDTTHAFNPMDYRHHPMSAATTNSPSDYASPGFFGAGNVDQLHSASFQPSFGMPYLSPMPEQLQPTGSPLSVISHHDPAIANHSPPHANVHRAPSADFLSGLSLAEDHDSVFDADDSAMLTDMYHKQMTLPIRSPMSMQEAQMNSPMKHEEAQPDEFDQNAFSFGTINPSAISQGM